MDRQNPALGRNNSNQLYLIYTAHLLIYQNILQYVDVDFPIYCLLFVLFQQKVQFEIVLRTPFLLHDSGQKLILYSGYFLHYLLESFLKIQDNLSFYRMLGYGVGLNRMHVFCFLFVFYDFGFILNKHFNLFEKF